MNKVARLTPHNVRLGLDGFGLILLFRVQRPIPFLLCLFILVLLQDDINDVPLLVSDYTSVPYFRGGGSLSLSLRGGEGDRSSMGSRG